MHGRYHQLLFKLMQSKHGECQLQIKIYTPLDFLIIQGDMYNID